MNIEPIKEWNEHTQRPVTNYLKVDNAINCLRCNLEIKDMGLAYWIHSDKVHGYVVCVPCFNQFEANNIFLRGFMRLKEIKKMPVRLKVASQPTEIVKGKTKTISQLA